MTENNFNFTNGVSYDVWYETKRLIDQLKKENEELKAENEEVDELKQECEKLKNQVDEDYNYYTTELKTLRDIVSNKEKRNAALFLMSNRYRKALEEIEKYTRKQFCDNCEDISSTEYNCHCEYCEYQEYFDIINKAKRQ